MGRMRGVQGNRGMVRRASLVVAAIACVWGVFAQAAWAKAPSIENPGVAEVSDTSATLTAKVNPNGKATSWHFEYGPADCSSNPCTSIPVPEGEIPSGSSSVAVKETITGLAPATAYHFLLVAKNAEGTTKSTDRVFFTQTEGRQQNDGRLRQIQWL